MIEIVLRLIKSASSVDALQKVKAIVTSAYHGEPTVIGSYLSNGKYSEIIGAIHSRLRELDESNEIIEALKDVLL